MSQDDTTLRQWCEECQRATPSWTDIGGQCLCAVCDPPPVPRGRAEKENGTVPGIPLPGTDHAR